MKAFVDLFCGAGGAGLGLKRAGLQPLLGVDKYSRAVEVYREVVGRSATHSHLFHPLGAKQMTGCFLLHRPMARRPGGARSAARGISTGVTSRGTPGRAVEGGQPIRVGFRFQAVRLGFRRSRAAPPLPLLKQMITKMATAVNPSAGRRPCVRAG
jgi:hypothetical protein